MKARSSTLAILVAAFIFASLGATVVLIASSIRSDARTQRAVRNAQIYRASVLQSQLDEETGMRGYLATRSSDFLEPYDKSRARFTHRLNRLRAALQSLKVSPSFVQREAAINHEWLTTVAEPSLLGSVSLEQQLRGKQLVDAFRAQDTALTVALDRRGEQSDADAVFLADEIAYFTLPVAAVIALALVAIAAQKRRLERTIGKHRRAYEAEKRIADALQQAFVPRRLPSHGSASLDAVYAPAGLEAKVGGDWYDAFTLSGDRILFSLGDVAGHGIDAAVTMSRVRQTILSVGLVEDDPAAILARVNHVLSFQDAPIVTAVCGFIDLARCELHFAMAGHPPLRLARPGGRITSLHYSAPPLGAVDEPQYVSQHVAIEPGSLLVLYTDGLVEYERDWVSGEAHLLRAIASVYENLGADPASAIMDAVFKGASPADDVAILTVSFRERSLHEAAGVAADVAAAAVRPFEAAQPELNPARLMR